MSNPETSDVSGALNKHPNHLGGKRIVPLETLHVAGREDPLYEVKIKQLKTWAKAVLEHFNN